MQLFQVRRINSRNTLSNDSRSVQHRLATSRIQQEIDEATEREKELREAGMIQTTSEETVDSKVCVLIVHRCNFLACFYLKNLYFLKFISMIT
jgi:hypothetical protein